MGGVAMTENKLTATFVFTETGTLEEILFHAENDKDQATLKRADDGLFKPHRFDWIKRIFEKGTNAMADIFHRLRIRSMIRIERLFFKMALRRRERIIQPQFDRQLSREIDCLQALIDG